MKKHCKRTVRDPMAWINKRMPLSNDQTTDLGLAYHVAMDAMLTEHASESAWSILACTINTALLLAERGVQAEAEPIIKLAHEALMLIRRRAKQSGNWCINLAHHHKQALFAALAYHDAQCSECTKGAIADALREIHRRIEVGEVLA
jgi:hypothetical protein